MSKYDSVEARAMAENVRRTPRPTTDAGQTLLTYIGVTPEGTRVIAASHVEKAVHAIEHAAVRAALEGLRAEVEDIDFDDLTNLGAQMRIAALIDERLADLP